MALWGDRTNVLAHILPMAKNRKERDDASSSVLPPVQSEKIDHSISIMPGQITVIDGAETKILQDLLLTSIKAGSQSRDAASLQINRLDKLPFSAPTVADALRHIGIPETRIRQLLLQIGLQSLANASPTALSPHQLRTLALVAALHGPQQTIILARPFEGMDPAIARKLADFVVVAALERKKSFVLLNPGPAAEAWKGNSWAVWQTLPGQVRPFGGMNLNIPQELLELQMARTARSVTQETIAKSLEEDASSPGIEFLEEKLARDEPFQHRKKSSWNDEHQLSQRTEQEGREGFFMLPFRKRKPPRAIARLQYFSREEPSQLRSMILLVCSVLMIAAAFALLYQLQR